MCGAILLRAENSLPLPLSLPLPSISMETGAVAVNSEGIDKEMEKDKVTCEEEVQDPSLEGNRIESLEGNHVESLEGNHIESLEGKHIESLEGKMVDLLIAEVEDSFRTLSLSTLRTDSTDIKDDDVVVCASSHPFTAPYTSCGRIDIPPKWRGAQVNFHASCSTPSKLASLNFFKTKAEYDADTPSYSFFGKPSDDTSTFKPFVLTDATCLYYRFGAMSGSDRSIIGVKSDDGNIFTDPVDDSFSIAEENSSTDIGLGEDDSLFNLFNEPEPDDPEGKSKCVTATSTHGVKAGLWFYEVTVIRCDEAEGLEQLAKKNVIGITSTFADASVDGEDSVNSAECSVSLTIAGAVVIRKKLHREIFEGRAVDSGLGGWTEGDVIGCLFEVIPSSSANEKAKTALALSSIDSLSKCHVTPNGTITADSVQINVWFHRNGIWSKCTKISSLVGQNIESCRSIFTIRGVTKLCPNFGESDFAYPPVQGSVEHIPDGFDVEVACDPKVGKESGTVSNGAMKIEKVGGREGQTVAVEKEDIVVTADGVEMSEDTVEEEVKEENTQGSKDENGEVESYPEQIIATSSNDGELSGDFLPSVSNNQSGILPGFQYPWLPMLARAVEEEDHPNAWGYHFEVRPLLNLKLRVSREFTLVWSLKNDESEAASVTRSKELFIWRPKKPSNYVTLGDMVTLSNHPPIGAVVAEKKLCVPPLSFIKVIGIKPLDLMIWRPVAPKGFVALGDIATKFLSTPQPLHECCYCVPIWATTDCDIGRNAFSSKKGSPDSKTYTFSLWNSRNLLGTFFGSPYEVARMTSAVSKTNLCDGVPKKAFGLKYDTLNALSGEWVHEEDVRSSKSLLWATSVLNYLLDNQSTRKRTLTAPLFSSVVDYIRSAGASGPLQAVPLLIRLVRLAYAENVELCMDSIKGLCNSILLKALNMVKISSSAPLSGALVRLVDLVVEVQTIEIAAVAVRQGRGVRSTSSSDYFVNIPQAALAKHSVECCEEDKEEKGDISEAFTTPGLTFPAEQRKKIEEIEEEEEVEGTMTGACSDDWWDRSCISKEDVMEAQIIKDEKLDVLFSNEHISRKLRQIINFLNALVTGPCQPNTAINSTSMHPSDNIPSYPRMLIAQVWQRHVSTCFIEESQHPYTERKMRKKVFFPGAEKLTVTFDRRSCVGSGAKIFLHSKGTTLEYSGSFGEDIELHGGIVFSGCELIIEFKECSLKNSSIEMKSEDTKVSVIENIICTDGKDTKIILSGKDITSPNVIESHERIGEVSHTVAPLTAIDESLNGTQEAFTVEELKMPFETEDECEDRVVNLLGDWGWGLIIQASGPLYRLRSVSAVVPHTIHTKGVGGEVGVGVGGEVSDTAAQTVRKGDGSEVDVESKQRDESLSTHSVIASACASACATSTALAENVLHTGNILLRASVPAQVSHSTEPAVAGSPASQHFSLDSAALQALTPDDVIDSEAVPSDDIPASTPTDCSGDPDSPNACRNTVRGGRNNNREEDEQFSVFRPRTRRGRERGEVWGWRREMRAAGGDTRTETDRPLPSPRMDRSGHRVGTETATTATTMPIASASAIVAAAATAPAVNAPHTHSAGPSSTALSAGAVNPFASSSSTLSSSSFPASTECQTTPSLPSTPPPLGSPTNCATPGCRSKVPTDIDLNDIESKATEDTVYPLAYSKSSATDELTSIEKYVNNNDRMLFAAATYGALIAEGELSVPHSVEMSITISRDNPLGNIYPHGLDLIKSVNGTSVELNMACAIIYAITFSYTCRSTDDGK